MSAVFDEWIAADVGTVYVQHFDSMLSALFNIYPVCVHAPTCGDALSTRSSSSSPQSHAPTCGDALSMPSSSSSPQSHAPTCGDALSMPSSSSSPQSHAPTCGDALAIEFNGDVYSCDHFVEPDYLLGNVTDYQFSEFVTSPVQRSFGAAKACALPGQGERTARPRRARCPAKASALRGQGVRAAWPMPEVPSPPVLPWRLP